LLLHQLMDLFFFWGGGSLVRVLLKIFSRDNFIVRLEYSGY
jgi:hypothetical protein